MSFWKRLWGEKVPPQIQQELSAVRLSMPDWTEEAYAHGDMRFWRDADGDVLSLAVNASLDLPELSNELAVQRYARDIAEAQQGGLIEVRVVNGNLGEALSLIYKQLQIPAYVFGGMILEPGRGASRVWTIIARERGTTGVREAMITSDLINSGQLTINEYQRTWAQDPYDPTYSGVDRSVLRFMSDDDCYDSRFPDHPLSKIRKILTVLPDCVTES